ncbi:glycosyltransferase family 4 protein [Phenylobacterium sp.]|jgi:glycosyltransferase involved in cell wall biosynthesis|uniref:glycosyltransferase family 4 protein n=1 Tax=Phenylobacterium sp. TaxID=1871053 RepID=UPI002F953E46
MKVMFANRQFDRIAGGVERMSIEMMNDLVARGHEVELVSLDAPHASTFYPLDDRVGWHRVGIGDPTRKATPREILARLHVIRQAIRRARPDVMIGFQQGAYILLALSSLGLGIPVIAAERNAPQRFDYLKDGHGRWFQFLSFGFAARITVQMESYRSHYPAVLRRRIVSIPNPVPQQVRGAEPGGHACTRKRLLCVARLSYQKNQSLLIEAFAKIANAFPDWDLTLVGGGEDEAKLQALARSLQLSERVEFIGAVTNVEEWYLRSHIFCLSSRWEGFPNALAEAMAFGLPAVGLIECAGVNELIQDGVTGQLAPSSADGLAVVLSALMASPDVRRAMGNAARAAMGPYAPQQVLDRWEALFSDVARTR